MKSKATAERLYLSVQDGIVQMSLDGNVLSSAVLPGAGALCADERHIFCADATGTLWRMNQQTLLPESVFCGGPGICDLCLSDDGKILYALLSDADSVLMLDGASGRPLLLNRCGCNPTQLLLRENELIAAGGESGCVYLYDAENLICTKEISMPGPVYAIAFGEGTLYALCLTAQLDTLLVAVNGESRKLIRLCGMPGGLLVKDHCLYAATQGHLYLFDSTEFRLLRSMRLPGRVSRMCACKNRVVMYDSLSKSVYTLDESRRLSLLSTDAEGICAR